MKITLSANCTRWTRRAVAAGGTALAEGLLGPVGTGLCAGVQLAMMLPSPEFHQFFAFGKQRTLMHLQGLKDNPALARQVQQQLAGLDGVERVRVSSERGSVNLDGPVTREDLLQTLQDQGWNLVPFQAPSAGAVARVMVEQLAGQALAQGLEPLTGPLAAGIVSQAVVDGLLPQELQESMEQPGLTRAHSGRG